MTDVLTNIQQLIAQQRATCGPPITEIELTRADMEEIKRTHGVTEEGPITVLLGVPVRLVDEPPPDVPVYQTPDGGTMWGTWEADNAEQQPDRLAAVMAYCAAHPYDGPEPDVQPLYVESRYDYNTDTRTAWTRDTVPEFIEIAAFFLEDDDSLVRFEDDAVVFPVQPRTLRYRPLYARYTSRTIVLQRIDEENAP